MWRYHNFHFSIKIYSFFIILSRHKLVKKKKMHVAPRFVTLKIQVPYSTLTQNPCTFSTPQFLYELVSCERVSKSGSSAGAPGTRPPPPCL